MLLQHRLWLAGWRSAHLRYRSLPDVQRLQLLLVSPSTPSWIHLILNNIQDYTVQALERKKSFLKGFLKMVRKNVFCSVLKCILPVVINITTLSRAGRAGLRTPDCDHFYFRNPKRSEYCYMKNFIKVVNSEDFREKKQSFCITETLQLPWATPNLHMVNWRKKKDSLCRNHLGSHIWSIRTYEIHATLALTPHCKKRARVI